VRGAILADRPPRCFRWEPGSYDTRDHTRGDQRLAAVGADLVLDEALLDERLAQAARHAGLTVWIAGPPLVEALRAAAGITRRGARPSAALLARLPAIPWLRSLLRRPDTPKEERQIKLL
jgi:hypothetical protein